MAFTDEQIAAFPAWLQAILKATPEARAAVGITDEYVDHAVKAFHLDKDYTQKSQRLSEYETKLRDVPADKAAELYAWWQQNGTVVTDLWNKRDKLVERQDEPAKPMTAAEKRKWREYEYVDPYDAERSRAQTAALREAFADLHADASQAGYQRWKDEYTKTEVPRLDAVAGGYFETMLNLVDFGLEDAALASKDPKHQRMNLNELIKQAALRVPQGQRADFRKVATEWRTEQLAAIKPIEEAARQAGIEEGRKLAGGPSGPTGGARPDARPHTPETAPKNRDELFQRVVSAVEQKSGRPVPI